MFNETKKTAMLCLMALAVLASFGASAAQTNVRDANTPGSGATYFLPAANSTYDAPYYRWHGEDWGWTHGAISGSSFTSASLNIGAWDVDYVDGERDTLSVFDSGYGWRNIGFLNGTSNAWAYGSFNLTSFLGTLTDDINSGLQVRFGIDARNAGWAVTLSKSVLEVDGGYLPPPAPVVSAVPEPETYAMLLAGLGLLGFTVRRRKNNAA